MIETDGEFLAWLDGFLEGDDPDVQRIRDELAVHLAKKAIREVGERTSYSFPFTIEATPSFGDLPTRTYVRDCGCAPGVMCGGTGCPRSPHLLS